HLAATSTPPGTANVWQVASGRLVLSRPCSASLVLFPAGGKHLAIGAGGDVLILDLTTGEKVLSLPGDGHRPSRGAYSADANRLAVLGGSGNRRDAKIKLWDMTEKPRARLLHGHTSVLHSLAFSPDGRLLATASMDRTARLWDTATGKELHVLPHSGAVYD